MATKKNLTKEEWEAMTGTDMSLILPSDGSIETARESSLNDTGKEKSEETVVQKTIRAPATANRKRGSSSLISTSYKQQAKETFLGRIPESLSSGSENRRPQTRVCQRRGT